MVMIGDNGAREFKRLQNRRKVAELATILGKRENMAVRSPVEACRRGTITSLLSSLRQKAIMASNGSTISGAMRRAIRQKVIGHRWRAIELRISQKRLLNLRGMLALLHQPASQKGGRIFFHPTVQEHADLFTKICGVGKSRKFIALQGIA